MLNPESAPPSDPTPPAAAAAGRHLAGLGFRVINGIDVSPEMLATARSTGHYDRLIEADLTRPLPLARGGVIERRHAEAGPCHLNSASPDGQYCLFVRL